MLGESLSMLLPRVVGFRLHGELPEGATATDLVLTITEMLRQHGVVGKFVEFYGPGVAATTLPDRLTIANMSPEFGSTCAYFPIDEETLRYLRFTGRPESHRASSSRRTPGTRDSGTTPTHTPQYSELVELDLATVVPSLAGPRRPQDRVLLTDAQRDFRRSPARHPRSRPVRRRRHVKGRRSVRRVLPRQRPARHRRRRPRATPTHGTRRIRQLARPGPTSPVDVTLGGTEHTIDHGSRRHRRHHLLHQHLQPHRDGCCRPAGQERRRTRAAAAKPWVKTSLSPGSKVVTDYLDEAGLTPYLEALGFHLAGYGCMTCIGASGPLIPEVTEAVHEHDLSVVSVLSGNRNFDGRINPDVRMNYLASPPLVVAYALAGTMDTDLVQRTPRHRTPTGGPVYLADIWPTSREIQDTIDATVDAAMFTRAYADVFDGDDRWRGLNAPDRARRSSGTPTSTYLRRPPYLDGMTPRARTAARPRRRPGAGQARRLRHHGPRLPGRRRSRRTHPPGSTSPGSGVERFQLNTYASRRGNHEVMMRGTFANVRLRNQLVPGVEGGRPTTSCTGKVTSVYDAAIAYRARTRPLVVLAGREYGSGSSRDWAAKGRRCSGSAPSWPSRSSASTDPTSIGMGVLPLQFLPGDKRGHPRPDRHRDLRDPGSRDAEPCRNHRHGDRRGGWPNLRDESSPGHVP